jgi:hypothetical protein
MLSKAEIAYLQGQKQVSKSYERKSRCLIKRKIEVLRKEIPLLSKLLLDNSGKSEDIMYRIKEIGKLKGFENQESNSELRQLSADNRATKYSNLHSKPSESDQSNEAKSLSLDKTSLSISDILTPATEFGNGKTRRATKNSNGDEIYNPVFSCINISKNVRNELENFNKSIDVSLISKWAGSDKG